MPTAAEVFEAAIARTRDPATSHTAALQYTATNRAKDLQLVHDLIRERPGHTAAEYSDILRQRGMNWYRAARMTTKRISELAVAGEIRVGKRRLCSVTDHKAQTYHVNEKNIERAES